MVIYFGQVYIYMIKHIKLFTTIAVKSFLNISNIYSKVLRALLTLRGLRGAPEVPPLCRETQSLGQQMLNAPVAIVARGIE